MSARRIALLFFFALSSASLCAAQGSPNTEQAAALAIEKGQEGIALYERGEWLAAIERFEQADALYHSPALSLYIARSLRSTGQYLAAKTVFERLIAERLPDDAPDVWRDAQSDARAELAALERALPRVVGTAETSPDLDPGAHEVVAVLAGPIPNKNRKIFFTGVFGIGLGGVALVTAGVTALLAHQQTSDVKRDVLPKYCSENQCPRSRKPEIEAHLTTARRLDTSANVLFWGGLATAALGVTLVLLDRRTALPVRGSASLGAGSLEVHF